MATLYRGTCNNGVHTFLSEESFKLFMERKMLVNALERNGVPYDIANQKAEATIPHSAIKIATFVRKGETYDKYFRGYVTGTLEDLDTWSKGHVVHCFSVDNFVPFSNGNLKRDLKYRLTPAEVIAMFELHR